MQNDKIISIDFLKSYHHAYNRPWKYFWKKKGWKIYSGNWEIKSPNRIHYGINPDVKTGENFSIWSTQMLKSYTFNVEFRISTASVRPPEGGVILYFNFKNSRNFCSFHFCPSKHKIEMIKRFKGKWFFMGEESCDLKIGQKYSASIATNHGFHSCNLDGQNLLESWDDKIDEGSIGIGVKYCDAEYRNVSIRFH